VTGPKKIVDDIVLGKQRYALVELVIELVETARDDLLPFVTSWEFFQHILIIHTMYQMHERGREASINDLSRCTRIPRAMLQRRLQELFHQEAIEQRGPDYVLAPAFFNSEFILNGFRRRRIAVTIAPKKMADPSNE
jgi:hypothetical protein